MNDEKECLQCGKMIHPSSIECPNGCKDPLGDISKDEEKQKEHYTKDVEKYKKEIMGDD